MSLGTFQEFNHSDRAQKCYSILLAFDAIVRTGIAEYKLASGLAQSWLKPVQRVVRERQAPLYILKTRGSEETFGSVGDLKKSPAQSPHASVFYPQQLIFLDSVVVFSYYLRHLHDIFMHPIAPPATEVPMPNGITRWRSDISSL